MMTVRDLVGIVDGELVCCEDKLDQTVEDFAASDLLSDVLAFSTEKYALLTGLTNAQIVRTADITNAHCIVVVRNKQPQQAAVAVAQATGIPIILSSLTMFEACARLSRFANSENDPTPGTANPSGTRADVPDQSAGGDDR